MDVAIRSMNIRLRPTFWRALMVLATTAVWTHVLTGVRAIPVAVVDGMRVQVLTMLRLKTSTPTPR